MRIAEAASGSEKVGRAEPADELSASVLTEIPPSLAVGKGTALFVAGRCRHSTRRISRLEVGLDGAFTPVRVFTTGGRLAARGRDLWWALLPIAPIEHPVTMTLDLRAQLAGGGEAGARLAPIELLPELPYQPIELDRDTEHDEPLIAICMATWNPSPQLFSRQIETIRAQSHPNWVCIIVDDASDPEPLARMQETVAGDERFVLRRFHERLGFYRNFERALALAPPNADYVALCDQDDAWTPGKLESLLAAFGPRTLLAYSDMRLVTPGGELISDTYWNLRETNSTDLRKLLLANTVTGAAAIFRRELLETALPLPPRCGELFHDHWLACVALTLGEISYVEHPLFDYVQHEGSAQGHAQANLGAIRPRRTLLRWLRSVPSVAVGRRIPRFYTRVYLTAGLIASVIHQRCVSRIGPEHLRTLRGFQQPTASAAAALLAASLRPGLRRRSTLGRERSFLAGMAWERLSVLRGRIRIGTRAKAEDL